MVVQQHCGVFAGALRSDCRIVGAELQRWRRLLALESGSPLGSSWGVEGNNLFYLFWVRSIRSAGWPIFIKIHTLAPGKPGINKRRDFGGITFLDDYAAVMDAVTWIWSITAYLCNSPTR